MVLLEKVHFASQQQAFCYEFCIDNPKPTISLSSIKFAGKTGIDRSSKQV